MTLNYAQGRIREALRIANGNPARARQLIAAWCFEDAKLLQSLARPHLKGIIAYAVDRVLSKGEEKPAPPPPEKPAPAGAEDPGSFGRDLLQALRGGETFGQGSAPAPRSSKAASKQHIDAIRALAGGSKTGKKRT